MGFVPGGKGNRGYVKSKEYELIICISMYFFATGLPSCRTLLRICPQKTLEHMIMGSGEINLYSILVLKLQELFFGSERISNWASKQALDTCVSRAVRHQHERSDLGISHGGTKGSIKQRNRKKSNIKFVVASYTGIKLFSDCGR